MSTENPRLRTYSFGRSVSDNPSLFVHLYQGCITKTTNASCIVHPTNENVDFTDSLGQTMLDVGGSGIKIKGPIESISKVGPPGNLQCQHIIHINIHKYLEVGWKKIINDCIDQAKELGGRTIAFPSLGIGQELDNIVQSFVDALGEHSSGSTFWINIVWPDQFELNKLKTKLDALESQNEKLLYTESALQENSSTVPAFAERRLDTGNTICGTGLQKCVGVTPKTTTVVQAPKTDLLKTISTQKGISDLSGRGSLGLDGFLKSPCGHEEGTQIKDSVIDALRVAEMFVNTGKPKPGWEDPLLLIESSDKSKFSINEKTAKLLMKIQEDVVIISIIGPYRSGKSYLLNLIADARGHTGFSIGDTEKAETQGMWIWCLQHPEKENTTLILMDSEGFGDVKKENRINDDHIFLLNILLSSTMIYNSMRVLDADAIDKLKHISDLADRVHVQSNLENTEEAFLSVFPGFVWILRDFTLSLQTETPDQYLADSLKCKRGKGKSIALYNSTRECIKEYFPSRKCFVLPPHEVPSMRVDVRNIRSYLLKNSKPKKILMTPIKGKELVRLAQLYTNAINNGITICIFDACGKIQQENYSEMLNAAINVFEESYEGPESYGISSEKAIKCFIEKKCYDVRYLLQLTIHMKERAEGRPKNRDITDYDVLPIGATVDKEYWDLFIELTKRDVTSASYVNDITKDQQKLYLEMEKQYNLLKNHITSEREKAKENQMERKVMELEELLLTMQEKNDEMAREYNDLVQHLMTGYRQTEIEHGSNTTLQNIKKNFNRMVKKTKEGCVLM